MRQRAAPTPLTVLVLLLSCSLAWGQAAPLKGLDTYANTAIHDWNVPGLAIAVVKDGKVVLSKGHGVRKVGEPAPVDEHTLFSIGSISKSFTAMALGMLVDEGKLSWDDPLSRYLPYFQQHLRLSERDVHGGGRGRACGLRQELG